MAMTAKQKEANARAHKSLADTRVVQRYLDTLDEIAELEDLKKELPELEAAFIKVAKRYSIRKGINRKAWEEFGLDPKILDKAGLP